MIKLRRLFRRIVMFQAFEGDGGGAAGGDVVDTAAPAPAPAADSAPTPAPAEGGAADAPQTMLDAMQRVWDRDDKGRFAGGVKEVPGAPAAAPGAPAAAPAATAAPVPGQQPSAPKPEEDLTAMPEGLGQKAQERFQKLATANRELTERASMLDQQVSYVRDTFQQHGIRQDQFEQAVGVISAMNRGDFAAAQQMLGEQMRQLSLLTGQPVAGLDALADFPDLRQRVDMLQMTEADAMELARLRKTQHVMQTQRQEQEREHQQSQQRQQQFQQAQNGVDAWVKEMAGKDIDWPAIEEQLLPDIGNLLKGVPPQAWLGVLQAQYNVLKRAAGTFSRRAAPAAEPVPLRPMAGGATQRVPQNMHEAMWGSSPRA